MHVFSFNDKEETLIKKIIFPKARIPISCINDKEIDSYFWEKFERGINYFTENSNNICIKNENIIENIREYIIENEPQIVFIDSINTLNEHENNASIMLKEIANNSDVMIICSANVTSWVEKRENKRPLIGDLINGEISSSVADKIFFLYRDDYYKGDESEDLGLIEIIGAKNHIGPIGTIKLRFFHEYMSFCDYTTSIL